MNLPGLRSRWTLLVVGACYAVALAVLYVHKPPNPDHGIFDYIGWIGSMGGRYYTDVAEQNFPGEMLLHEAAFRIFGVKFWAYRALDFALLAVATAALWDLLRRAGLGVGAIIGAAFYVTGYVSANAWMSGQRDIVAANLLLIASQLYVCRLNGMRRIVNVPIGLLLVFTLLLRPTYVIFVASLPALDWSLMRRHSRRPSDGFVDTALVAGVMLAGVGCFVGWGAIVGSLNAFHEQAIQFNFQAYSAGHERGRTAAQLLRGLLDYWWYVPAAAIGVVIAVRRQAWSAPLLLLLGLALLAPISAFAQNKGFGYHLGALIPPLFGLAGAGLGRIGIELFEAKPPRKFRGALALGAIGAVLSGFGLLRQVKSLGPQIRYCLGRESFMEMMARESGGQSDMTWADVVAAAEYVKQTTTERDTILVWARPVGIHILSQRRSPTRFITSGMLVLAKPPFEGAAAWTLEFAEVLRERPPRIIFLPEQHGELDYGAFTREDDVGPVIGTLRHLVATNYVFNRNFGSLNAYARRD